MTFSIVAKDPASDQVGVAIASCALAVGGICVRAASGVGAVATQARTNPLLGIDLVAGMGAGQAVDGLLEKLIAGDDGRAMRQVHVVDMAGKASAWTGGDCVDWAGHYTGAGFSVAGNMLVGERVIGDMAKAFEAPGATNFPLRLIAAMDAGEAAGGDKRGKQSAAIYVIGDQDYAECDLRVDDHEHPLAELRRLLALTQSEAMRGFRAGMPRR